MPVLPSGAIHADGPAASSQMPGTRRPAGVDAKWLRLNPELDDLTARQGAAVLATSTQNQDVPTLFESGDLPPFTASGIDPHLLANVPWTVRHAIAETPDRAAAMELLQAASGEHAGDIGAEYWHDRPNRDYRRRVESWVSKGALAVDREREQYRQGQQVAASTATSVKPVGEMTDGEVYDAVFGDVERREDGRIDDHRQRVAAGTAVGYFGDTRGGLKSTERVR
ncbi:hypothetical protein [Dactylosporangium sp. NPDC051484]|uniref:hypothetical protein n=1 Tax=Dactylosporangium sp. NPDC051484 TaxID=3154942 RepID=UPI00344BF5EB